MKKDFKRIDIMQSKYSMKYWGEFIILKSIPFLSIIISKYRSFPLI